MRWALTPTTTRLLYPGPLSPFYFLVVGESRRGRPPTQFAGSPGHGGDAAKAQDGVRLAASPSAHGGTHCGLDHCGLDLSPPAGPDTIVATG
jgi:hypothetical protein